MDAPGATEVESASQAHLEQQGTSTVQATNDEHEQRDESTQGGPGSGDEGGEQHSSEDDDEGGDDGEQDDNDDEEEEEEEEEEEPKLKYAYLTKQIGSVYRNGDATSSFLTVGDKMIIGTHNGNIHVLSLPQLQPVRVYHAHSASVTSISVSPFPLPVSTVKIDAIARLSADDRGSIRSSSSSFVSRSAQPKGYQGAALVSTGSNAIHIATSSIDGNVCVASLTDPRDVLLRNFGRPVQAVALSPEYKQDKSFLSGGRAGDLILTTGGRVGTTTNSTTMGGAAATASSWLGSIGLGGNNGKDTILHSGEGAISTIKWSLSGKYVVWVNEEGIKLMRSNLHLDSADLDLAWKRVSHIDRPNSTGWEEMAGVWKARAEWIDMTSLDKDDGSPPTGNSSRETLSQLLPTAESTEKLVVGWGGTVWVINVFPDRPNKNAKEPRLGSAEVAAILRTDCIISGISMYTPSLLMVLAYIEDDESSRRGNRRQKGLEPELRIINIETKEEVSADTLAVSRYENLAPSDYHMSVLPPFKTPINIAQRGALGALGNGLWDATMYPARLFSSGASIRSNTSGSRERGSSKAPSSFASRRLSNDELLPKEIRDAANAEGTKIFIHSPYDCVVAVKRDLSDRLAWLDSHGQYEEAWKLLDEHPEAAGSTSEYNDALFDEPTGSQDSLGEFFADERSSVTTIGRNVNTVAEQEKRRIGEKWIDQLIKGGEWDEAAETCCRVLQTGTRWDHWAWVFIKAQKFAEITTHIPTDLHPPLSSQIYEVILGHYVTRDPARLKELLDTWPLDLFDVDGVTVAIEDHIRSNEIASESDDWRLLMESLAKLFLAAGHYREALRCYIHLQDGDAAMSLIREHRLVDAVSDDIPAFISIRVSKQQIKSAPITELEEITAEPIKLLVGEAYTGIVPPQTVVSQLQAANRLVFLYFYLRALWRGESLFHEGVKLRRGRGVHRDAANRLAADEGKALIDPFADTAVELFAEYDRTLLMEFLQISTSYAFDSATAICEQRRYTPELIYLLSKMGQTKKALNLILSDLQDVSQAISFAKSQNDPDLWEDLLDYSMDKPRFIHGLLVEGGTAIDPIKLVRRIPSGLEIEGLREGLTRMIREHDLQASISQGAAKVLQSEVALGMDSLRRGQRRGIKFNIAEPTNREEKDKDKDKSKDPLIPTETTKPSGLQPGCCGGCHAPFQANEKEILVGFACGHVFHLSHLHPPPSSQLPSSRSSPPPTRTPTADTYLASTSRTVGPKVITARLLRDRVGEGCRICALGKKIEALGESDR
ncbi:hypothetical protein ASPZODRAFT_56678 [Penicilliopsis zonata CBS 506.65]|uniref:Vps41 beta-propeller domain-containing protein n=1 Tax=Penicilliopsis zonata CBS 506.65 TaxID=1073090 RepID=A0A1L9SWY0_9EURO|nr:hypothetical protein ASPZODRAFT_56678 [Penicilliopsis zonata CBS 506.65]OJJ51601.1 hypothetical protein ASPZODRAFT_56678 [Penicilliopsis zonata CBS 506.65]